MKRWQIAIWLVIILLISIACTKSPTDPNILMINIDTLITIFKIAGFAVLINMVFGYIGLMSRNAFGFIYFIFSLIVTIAWFVFIIIRGLFY